MKTHLKSELIIFWYPDEYSFALYETMTGALSINN